MWIMPLPPRSPTHTLLGRWAHVLQSCNACSELCFRSSILCWSLLKTVVGLDRILARLIFTLSENLPACILTQIVKVEQFINNNILQQCFLFNYALRCTWNLQVLAGTCRLTGCRRLTDHLKHAHFTAPAFRLITVSLLACLRNKPT